MPEKIILYSSYNCDPYDFSEYYIAFIWLKILLKKFNIILLTNKNSELSINRYYNYHLPDHLKIISFTDEYPFKKSEIVRNKLLLGYFFFNYKIKRYLTKNPEIINSCDIIYQKNPESFRYFTSLVNFSKPVYIGPLGGGLKPPFQLKSYFKNEPFLFKLRNLDSLILKLPVYKNQFLKVAKVLVSVDYMDDILPAGYLKNKKVLLNCGVDCSEYPQAESAKGTINILYVGRLTRFKGAELLIKALNGLKRSDFILNILGDGEERVRLENLVKKYGLFEKVKFHGFKPADELNKFYQSASIFCLPTITESLGIVFFSAMASGLPIITIDNGGPKYICPDKGAIKIPIGTEEEIIKLLSDSILNLINNPEKRKEMGEFNRKYCLENYEWKILEEKILNFFSDEITSLRQWHENI